MNIIELLLEMRSGNFIEQKSPTTIETKFGRFCCCCYRYRLTCKLQKIELNVRFEHVLIAKKNTPIQNQWLTISGISITHNAFLAHIYLWRVLWFNISCCALSICDGETQTFLLLMTICMCVFMCKQESMHSINKHAVLLLLAQSIHPARFHRTATFYFLSHF